jgi:hypothetical protein
VAGETGSAKRTEIIEPVVTDDGRMVFDMDRAEAHLGHLLSTLLVVGGSARIIADRVKVGSLPPDGGGRREPLGMTVGLVVEWTAAAPLHEVSATLELLSRGEEPEPELAPALTDELAAGLEGGGQDEAQED